MRTIKEIGSEFWDVPTTNEKCDIWNDGVQWYISGRSALQAIIKDISGIRSVAMPSWCCHSMIEPFIDVGIDVKFYPVYLKDGCLMQYPSKECDAILLMEYFGFSQELVDLDGYKGKIIQDVSHSIFSNICSNADYYFGSLRKWCGVWTGGYVWNKHGHRLTMENESDKGFALLRKRGMKLKNSYINGCINSKDIDTTNREYLRIFENAEEILDGCGILPAADRDVELAKCLDVEFIRSKRRENAKRIMNAFSEWLVFGTMNDADCPLFVPIIVPGGKRDELREYLIKSKIYCPVHWPVSKYHKLGVAERFIYDNELSLVCDQRYDERDMERMIESINNFWGEQ